jgi:hypothetical protein
MRKMEKHEASLVTRLVEDMFGLSMACIFQTKPQMSYNDLAYTRPLDVTLDNKLLPNAAESSTTLA